MAIATARQATPSPAPLPVRLRPTAANAIGTTAFFRNRPLFQTLLDVLEQLGQEHYNLWFHACSIGAEVYSFVMSYLLSGMERRFSIQCHASDLNPDFLAFAEKARYPKEILHGLTPAEMGLFMPCDNGLTVIPEVRGKVRFAAPMNFVYDHPEQPQDVVLLLNALVYVTRVEQARAIAEISGYNRLLLVTSAFHQETIRDDLQRHGYNPILRNQKEIHDAWSDRRLETPAGADPQRGIFADWSLPPFSRIADYQYRYCSLFRKYPPQFSD